MTDCNVDTTVDRMPMTGHRGRIPPWRQRQAWICSGDGPGRGYRLRHHEDPPIRRGRGSVASRGRRTPGPRYRPPIPTRRPTPYCSRPRPDSPSPEPSSLSRTLRLPRWWRRQNTPIPLQIRRRPGTRIATPTAPAPGPALCLVECPHVCNSARPATQRGHHSHQSPVDMVAGESGSTLTHRGVLRYTAAGTFEPPGDGHSDESRKSAKTMFPKGGTRCATYSPVCCQRHAYCLSVLLGPREDLSTTQRSRPLDRRDAYDQDILCAL